jgi:hypothetical protein
LALLSAPRRWIEQRVYEWLTQPLPEPASPVAGPPPMDAILGFDQTVWEAPGLGTGATILDALTGLPSAAMTDSEALAAVRRVLTDELIKRDTEPGETRS